MRRPPLSVRGKIQNNPGGDPISQGLNRAATGVKNIVKGAGEEVKYLGGQAKNWLNKGAPLPGATQPKPGYTYLRGAQVKMPGRQASGARAVKRTFGGTPVPTPVSTTQKAMNDALEKSKNLGVGVGY